VNDWNPRRSVETAPFRFTRDSELRLAERRRRDASRLSRNECSMDDAVSYETAIREAGCSGSGSPSWSDDHCPVCDVGLDVRALPVIVLRRARGRQSWTKCPECHSFFAAETYDVEQEVAHTRTRAWGNVETAVSLGQAKGPLFDAILAMLRSVAPRGSSLLDIGCSYGDFLERARNEGYHVHGVDIVPEAVEYVRSRGILCDRAASVADLDIPDNSQDVVSVLDSNYYWPNHRRELRAIRARLRRGGVLVMRVVDTSWAMQLGMLIGRVHHAAGRRLCERVVYDHRVSVPLRSLLKVLHEEGFGVFYISVRDAVPFQRNTLKVQAAYVIGRVLWRIAGYNLAPGVVVLAKKEGSPNDTARAGAADCPLSNTNRARDQG
jgi:SAM-dependent methyltransferase